MTFSGYNVEQRSKEIKTLKSFLTYSLVGSMVLHLGLLSSGLANLLIRVPQGEDQSIEIAIADPVTEEAEKPPKEILAAEKPPSVSGGGGGGGSISEIALATATPLRSIAPKPQVTKQEPPVQKLVERFKAPQVPQQPEKNIVEKTQPVNELSQEVATQPQSPTTNSPNQSSDNLRKLLSGLRNSSSSQENISTSSGLGIGSPGGNGIGNGSGNGIGSGSGNGIGSGSGNGIGSGSGNGIGSGSGNTSTVATAPTPPKITTESNPNRSVNGRAACRECNVKYPESAKRQRVEGRVEVAVDTDAQGNVTNVRIAKSSGNRELDEETARQARNWKLKPVDGGRQGVAIATEFALQGSRRYRQVQERKRQRETEENNQQTTANTNNTQEAPRQRRLLTSTSNNVSTDTSNETRVRRRRTLTTELTSNPQQSTNVNSSVTRRGNVRESLRRLRREQTANNPGSQNTNRRRRRENSASSSQNKLRATLRSLRQSSQSQPAPTTQE
ncbi:energy transducer TonB [Nostoc sp. TCL26-01]|uniref:energy transducer TonB n=1 Tax=Nostoc sp. TCL26-01 TaxID=2576904 RepID=UPI0015BBCB0E|nr:energy transducer TonB [Nostoc sp. TCL26-01]QLE56604.1 energy transducer TonB [Nostoc sp. TCL26-01]